MPIQMTITSTAVMFPTINLQSSGYKVLDGYYPSTVQSGDVATDRFDVLITGTSGANVAARLQALEVVFEYARMHKNDDYPVYLNVAMESSGTLYRSRVTDGMVSLSSRLVNTYPQNKIIVQVTVERVPWWEGPSVAVTLNNANGSGTGAINVYNCADTLGTPPNKHVNYIDTYANSVSGDLPAAARIVIGTQSSADNISKLMIGQYAHPYSATYLHNNETENTIVDATCSGGSYEPSSAPTYDFYIDIASQWGYMVGRYYRVLVRARTPAGTTWSVTPWAAYPITSGPTIKPYIDQYFTVCDLGIIDLVNILYMPVLSVQIELVFNRLTGAGAIDVDYIQVIPLDGWTTLTLPTMSGQSGSSTIIIEELHGRAYTINSNYTTGLMASTGKTLMIVPNLVQRFYFLWNRTTPTNPNSISDYITVSMTAWPRRRTI